MPMVGVNKNDTILTESCN